MVYSKYRCPLTISVEFNRKRDMEERLESSEEGKETMACGFWHCRFHCLIPPLPPRRHYAAVPHAHTDTGSPFHDQGQSSEAP